MALGSYQYVPWRVRLLGEYANVDFALYLNREWRRYTILAASALQFTAAAVGDGWGNRLRCLPTTIAGSFTTSGGRCQSDIKKLLLTPKHSSSPKEALLTKTHSFPPPPPQKHCLITQKPSFSPPKKHCLLRSTLSPPGPRESKRESD